MVLIIQDLKHKTTTWQSQTRHLPSAARGQYNFGPGLIVMKFGEQLRSSVIKEYQWYYLAYDELKEQLKTPYETGTLSIPTDSGTKKGKVQQKRTWTEEDEGKFIAHLEQELDKIHTKQKVKAIEVGRRIASAQREVSEIVARLDSRGPVAMNGNADVRADEPTEEEFMLLDEDLNDIIADVHDLAKFVQLNYTGFEKIIKKHDVGISSSGGSLVVLTDLETNWMDAEACLCDKTQGEALLQG